VIGVLGATSPDLNADFLRAFREALKDSGFVESENVAIVYLWAEHQIDRLPGLAAELTRRRVAVLATIGNAATLASKAATTTIPIVFQVGDDPVRLGLVASLARPGGNLTGANFFAGELAAKRLELLHELVPAATRVAVLINPGNPNAEAVLRDVQAGARAKSKSTTPRPPVRSMPPSRLSCASGPTRFLLAPILSSAQGVSNWPF
jgi:putative ABC transport system substrate-binding protein